MSLLVDEFSDDVAVSKLVESVAVVVVVVVGASAIVIGITPKTGSMALCEIIPVKYWANLLRLNKSDASKKVDARLVEPSISNLSL